MTDRELRVELYINPQREQALQQYETMTCHLCGELMKKYIAHYPHQAHVRCLLRKFGNLKQALCCCRGSTELDVPQQAA